MVGGLDTKDNLVVPTEIPTTLFINANVRINTDLTVSPEMYIMALTETKLRLIWTPKQNLRFLQRQILLMKTVFQMSSSDHCIILQEWRMELMKTKKRLYHHS